MSVAEGLLIRRVAREPSSKGKTGANSRESAAGAIATSVPRPFRAQETGSGLLATLTVNLEA